MYKMYEHIVIIVANCGGGGYARARQKRRGRQTLGKKEIARKNTRWWKVETL